MSVAVEAAAVVAALDRLGVRRQRMTLDSRDIKPGDVFVALPGSRVDGRQFVRAALDAGAAAVLQEAVGADPATADARMLNLAGLSAQLGYIASEFYGHPASGMRVFGVTGTNGKTSITNWLMQTYSALGLPCAAIGTLGVTLGERDWPTSNTTPDAVHLQTILRDLRAAGAAAGDGADVVAGAAAAADESEGAVVVAVGVGFVVSPVGGFILSE